MVRFAASEHAQGNYVHNYSQVQIVKSDFFGVKMFFNGLLWTQFFTMAAFSGFAGLYCPYFFLCIMIISLGIIIFYGAKTDHYSRVQCSSREKFSKSVFLFVKSICFASHTINVKDIRLRKFSN